MKKKHKQRVTEILIGGIEGMDDNGKPINKIGVWTKKGFIETPIEQLLSSKNKTTKNERK